MSKLFRDMSFEEQITWGVGQICMALGRGEVRTAVYNLMWASSKEGAFRAREACGCKKCKIENKDY